MRSGSGWFLGGALALALSAAMAQTPTPLLKHTFDENESGWTGFGTNARATISQQTSFNGKGALKFEYDVKKGDYNALVLPTQDGALAKAKAFRFWIRPDHTTTLAVILQEQDGGRYTAAFNAPKDKWQPVEISTADFVLMEGKDDPADPNSRLDMDRVIAFAIGDFSQFFAQIDNADLAQLFNIKMGTHVLYLDDFSATEETLPVVFSSANTDVRIDTFARPQLNWLSVGVTNLSRTEGKPLEGRGLQADYRQAPMKIAGLMRAIPRGKLAGTGRLTFSVASTKRAMLLVQLEEAGGGKFNTTVEVSEGGASKVVTVDFADLNPADDSSVKDRKVDPTKVNQIGFLDAIGMLGGGEGDNTLWIGGLRASPAK